MELLFRNIFSDFISAHRLSGGDINDVYKVTTSDGDFVVKLNDSAKFPGMFEAEARGLVLLQNGGIRIPEVVKSGVIEKQQFLVLEYLESGTKASNFSEAFGSGLAALHQITQDDFGLNHDNYIGSLPQSNQKHTNWTNFYVQERLEPLVKMAMDSGQLSKTEGRKFDGFYNKLDDLLPFEQPALVHGDLWAGNAMTGSAGEPVLIDPAVYFGHREMDLGMMHLFGGFDKAIFEYYHEFFPLEAGWKQRMPYTQLYPLLVHVNLFGRSYWGSVEQILTPFV